MPKKPAHILFILLISIICYRIFIYSVTYHKEHDHVIWRKEVYADAAGYYSYLLMWYDYGYKTSAYPAGIDSSLGSGIVTKDLDIVKDKYTSGPALLMAPFYLLNKTGGHIYHYNTGPADASSLRMVDSTAVFYLWLGCICLYFFLVRYIKPGLAFLSLFLVVAGTNVCFYAVYHPGMSHIYSFFLFSAYIFLGDLFVRKKNLFYLFLLGMVAGLIVLTRPTDILFLPVILFTGPSILQNISAYVKPLPLLILAIAALVVCIPQMHYWYAYSGKLVYYSYGNEGFKFLKNPRFLQVLFAPDNGLILYSPVIILLWAANIYAIVKKKSYAIFFLVYQLAALYLIASWHIPNFGCSYGQRNYVQVFAGFALPLGYTLQQLYAKKNKLLFFLYILLGIGTVVLNQRIIYKYEYCYNGLTVWNWKEYWYYIHNVHLTLRQDFEQVSSPAIITNPDAHSGNHVLAVDTNTEYYRVLEFKKSSVPLYLKRMYCSMYVYSPRPDVRFDLTLKVFRGDSLVASPAAGVVHWTFPQNKWAELHTYLHYRIPDDHPDDTRYVLYLRNIFKQDFLLDDLSLTVK